jgi:hypothetical protein
MFGEERRRTRRGRDQALFDPPADRWSHPGRMSCDAEGVSAVFGARIERNTAFAGKHSPHDALHRPRRRDAPTLVETQGNDYLKSPVTERFAITNGSSIPGARLVKGHHVRLR